MRDYLTFALVITSVSLFGQTKNIKDQAELTAKALMHDDYETLLKFTYPKVMEMVGGPERMISLIRNGKVEMKKRGIGFESVTIGEPSKVVIGGKEMLCLIPQTIFMKAPDGKIRKDSYLLGVSQDNGNHWFFIDTVNLTMENVRLVVPDYNSDLKIPAKKQPEFIAD